MDSKKVVVGMIGFPNVGKSSIINVLINKKNVGVTSTPGIKVKYKYYSLTINFVFCSPNEENKKLNMYILIKKYSICYNNFK